MRATLTAPTPPPPLNLCTPTFLHMRVLGDGGWVVKKVAGPPCVPPSRAPPYPPVPGPPLSPRPARTPAGRTSKVKNVFCFKIDAKSVPEALATTILILQKFSIDLAHRQNHGASAHPAPSDAPHPHLIGNPRHPWLPPGAHGTTGGRAYGGRGGYAPEFRNPNNNPIIVSILPRGAEFGMGGEGGPSNSANRQMFQSKKADLGPNPNQI